jgi:hypothetical protein
MEALRNSHLPFRSRSAIIGLVGALAILIWARPVLAGNPQRIQGTSTSLAPMEGFEPASGFAGFMNSHGGSILVVEMPEQAYRQISEKLGDLATARSEFAKKNIVVDRLEEITTADGSKTPLLAGSQRGGDNTAYDKWIAVFKGPRTVLITVTSPKANRLNVSAVRAMMESVSVGNPTNMADKLAALPFSVAAAPPFRILDSLAGTALGMTVGDKDVDPARTQPVLIIAYELYELEDPADLERIPMPKALRNPQIESRIAVKFAGYNGLLLNGRSDGGRRFSQYMALTGSKRVITMLVEATESEYDGLKPAVETIAKSVAIKEGK